MSFERILAMKNRAQLADKASKTWGAQGEVTLGSGYTGHLYYKKNDLGQVRLYGSVVVGTGTVGTVIGTLPSGFFNPTYTSFMIQFNATTSVNAQFYINTSGELRNASALSVSQTVHFNTTITP